MWWCKLIFLLFVVVIAKSEDGFKEVKTAQGKVRGYKDPETGVFAFYGIPYATAPAGPHRFKAPLPGPAWLQPLEAVDKNTVCTQVPNPFIANKDMKDNCLVTSVFVPDTNEKKLPVVVYVHGGAFQLGFGNMVEPLDFVKNKHFVAVTFNYRLGVNGFLCLGTKEAPGNAGLKDQVALLRWVKKNIANFGGNPDDVTIVGGSAGSVSVDLLMLSKTTKGLFNKVIPESGAAVGAIALQVDPIEYAKNVALNLRFTDVDDIYALEKFYQEGTYKQFYEIVELFQYNSTFGFTPCVERDIGTEVFLHDTPMNILKSGKYKKVPMLYGFAEMEGLLQMPNFAKWKDVMNEQFSKFLPVDLQFASEAEKEEVAKKIKEFYFGEKSVDESTVLKYVDYFTDITFAYPHMLETKLHVDAGHDQLYLYEYSFVHDDTPVVPHTNVRGANHCAQTLDVLRGRKHMNPADTHETEEYNAMTKLLQDLWFNFITTGKPVPENSSLAPWPAVGANRSPYMSIGDKMELKDSLLPERTKFWDGIYSKYYRMPIPPPEHPPRPHTEL